MKCPKCGSENCQFVTTSHTHSKSFGLSDACCGWILMGPVGLLCGFCGAGSSTSSKEFWICNHCGSKFSQRAGEKYMQGEGKLKEILFYTEVQNRSSQRDHVFKTDFVEKVKYGIDNFLIRTQKGQKVFCSNPVVRNQTLESIKEKYRGFISEKDLVYVIIAQGSGIIIAEKGFIVSEMIFHNLSGTVTLYESCVYIGQVCVRTENAEEALELYRFINYIYDLKPEEKQIRSYEELLMILQGMQDIPYGNKEHYSSQQEYASYISGLKTGWLNQFAVEQPERYDEYMRAEKNRKIAEKCVFIIFLAGLIIPAFTGLYILGVILFVIDVVMFGKISKGKKDAMCEYIPEHMRAVFEEDEKKPIEKEGKIRLDLIINARNEVQVFRGQKCAVCGKEIPDNAQYCRHCGSKVQDGQGKKCAVCGKEIPDSARYCVYCGSERASPEKRNEDVG